MVGAHGHGQGGLPDAELAVAVDDGQRPQPRTRGGLGGDPRHDLARAGVGGVGDALHPASGVVIAHPPVEGDDGSCRPVLDGGGELGDVDGRLADLGADIVEITVL